MQYRGKNQMSPDLFSLPDSLTQKTQEWFLNFNLGNLGVLDKIPSLKNL